MKKILGFSVFVPVFVLSLALVGFSFQSAHAQAPTLSTDKADYAPGETVTISGSFFDALQNIILTIFGGSETDGTYTELSQNVTADESGSFTASYTLDYFYRPLYIVAASTQDGSLLAETSFTDGSIKAKAAPAGTTFTLTKTKYSTSNCTGVPLPSGTTVNLGVDSVNGNSTGTGNTESVKFEAAALSDQGGAFVNWTSAFSFTVINATTICATGFPNGFPPRDYFANYGSVAVPPSLTLVKEVVLDNGGSAVATDWTISASGPTPISGAGTVTSGPTFTAGTYTLSEGGPSGYSASAWVCTGDGIQSGDQITLANGETATCTITNDDIPPSLTLVKDVVTDNGGNEVATDWTVSAAGPSPISGAGGAGSGPTFQAGTYTLSELGPSGYTASAWSCVGDGTQVGDQISLTISETATCTITNDDIAPTLTLIKDPTNDNDGTAAPDDFDLTIGGNPTLSGVPATLDANTSYAIDETMVTGYQFVSITGDAKCPAVLGGTLILDEGENVTCTITNDDIPGEIHGFKFYDINRNGIWDSILGEPGISGWTINLAGTLSGSTLTGLGGSYAFLNLNVGTYTVTETLQAGWTQTSANPAPISIALAQIVNDVNFGNFCSAATGGKSMGFWSNKNGQVVINDGGTSAPEMALLAGLNLRNANGSNFDPATYAQYKNWLLKAEATNMAYMLSAQLSAVELAVEAGLVSGGTSIIAPELIPYAITSPLGVITINSLMTAANTELGAHANTVTPSAYRAYQEALKNVLEKVALNQSIALCPIP